MPKSCVPTTSVTPPSASKLTPAMSFCGAAVTSRKLADADAAELAALAALSLAAAEAFDVGGLDRRT